MNCIFRTILHCNAGDAVDKRKSPRDLPCVESWWQGEEVGVCYENKEGTRGEPQGEAQWEDTAGAR